MYQQENGERIQQLSDYLGDINNKNIRKLTVGSIILGATITISSSLINNNNKAINIGAGAALHLDWSILNEKSFSNSGDKSMRETLKDRWLLYAFDGKPDAKD
ncbi:hypothetical protein ELAN_12030 [Elizabethkingia anophelis]|uniref:hypothetical protein n=1 Tax=Elizabethkingia anophelis TaxID=1117645 RepID=UPI0020B63EBE|nr:hypothetical protein [Elizabethkingia anophelis]UXM67229.1 hypothetical protein N7E57_16655 [Elizabethkingia anophelis]GJN57648.1 hypothetical protein ELAN_12030 [Elizabethkingia anophelis]